MKKNKISTLRCGGAEWETICQRSEDSDKLSIFDSFPPASGEVVAQLVFGSSSFEPAARARMAGAPWPVLWIQGDVCPEGTLSGAQTLVLRGKQLRYLTQNGRVIGSCWSDDDADYCLLAGVLPTDIHVSRGAQTTSCFEQIEAGLVQAGMDFSHLVRTWLYLDKLLDWYDEFNAARTKFFQERDVFERLIPASTGIGGGNPAGAALATGALAIRPKNGRVQISEVASPLQCPAPQYRSSFSRAVEMEFSDHRRITISGTASIAPGGETEYVGDVEKQIHLTLDVVEAILHSRGMDWKNTVRAVGYFRDIANLPLFELCCRTRGIPALPLTPAHTIVCRDDLLFEMELDAVSTFEL